MSQEATKKPIDLYLLEYDKLKAEQIQRIGFRDNMIYVTLVAAGSVGAFALNDSKHLYALLIIPWICLVLGWMYQVNDEKISAIGKYIRITLDKHIREQIDIQDLCAFGWEVEHRDDDKRKQRKVMQFAVDQITFIGPGISSIAVYWLRVAPKSLTTASVCIIELLFLFILAWQIYSYADLQKGR